MAPPKNDKDDSASSGQSLRSIEDRELLGPDYKDWLSERRTDVKRTLDRGRETRSRAEKAIEEAKKTIKKSGEILGDDKA